MLQRSRTSFNAVSASSQMKKLARCVSRINLRKSSKPNNSISNSDMYTKGTVANNKRKQVREISKNVVLEKENFTKKSSFFAMEPTSVLTDTSCAEREGEKASSLPFPLVQPIKEMTMTQTDVLCKFGLFPPQSNWCRTPLDYAMSSNVPILLRVFDGPFLTVVPRTRIISSTTISGCCREHNNIPDVLTRSGAIGVVSVITDGETPQEPELVLPASTPCVVVGIDVTDDALPPPHPYSPFFTFDSIDNNNNNSNNTSNGSSNNSSNNYGNGINGNKVKFEDTCRGKDASSVFHPTGELYSPRDAARRLLSRLARQTTPSHLEQKLANLDLPSSIVQNITSSSFDVKKSISRMYDDIIDESSLQYDNTLTNAKQQQQPTVPEYQQPKELFRVLLTPSCYIIGAWFIDGPKSRNMCSLLGKVLDAKGELVDVPTWLCDDDFITRCLLRSAAPSEDVADISVPKNITVIPNSSCNIVDFGSNALSTNTDDTTTTTNAVTNDMCDVVSFHKWSDLIGTTETITIPSALSATTTNITTEKNNKVTNKSVAQNVANNIISHRRYEQSAGDFAHAENLSTSSTIHVNVRNDVLRGSAFRLPSFDISDTGNCVGESLTNTESQFTQLNLIVFGKRGYAGRNWTALPVPSLALCFPHDDEELGNRLKLKVNVLRQDTLALYLSEEPALERLCDAMLLSQPQYIRTGFMTPLFIGRSAGSTFNGADAITLRNFSPEVAKVAAQAQDTVYSILHHGLVYSVTRLFHNCNEINANTTNNNDNNNNFSTNNIFKQTLTLTPCSYRHFTRGCCIAMHAIALTSVEDTIIDIISGRLPYVVVPLHDNNAYESIAKNNSSADNIINYSNNDINNNNKNMNINNNDNTKNNTFRLQYLHNCNVPAPLLDDSITLLKLIISFIKLQQKYKVINTSDNECEGIRQYLKDLWGYDVNTAVPKGTLSLLDALTAASQLLNFIVIVKSNNSINSSNAKEESTSTDKRFLQVLRDASMWLERCMRFLTNAHGPRWSTLQHPYNDVQRNFFLALLERRNPNYECCTSALDSFITEHLVNGPPTYRTNIYYSSMRYWMTKAYTHFDSVEPGDVGISGDEINLEFSESNIMTAHDNADDKAKDLNVNYNNNVIKLAESTDLYKYRTSKTEFTMLNSKTIVPQKSLFGRYHWRSMLARGILLYANSRLRDNRSGSYTDSVIDYGKMPCGFSGTVAYSSHAGNALSFGRSTDNDDRSGAGLLALSAVTNTRLPSVSRCVPPLLYHGMPYPALSSYIAIRRLCYLQHVLLAHVCSYKALQKRIGAPLPNTERCRTATGISIDYWNDLVRVAAVQNTAGIGAVTVIALRLKCNAEANNDRVSLFDTALSLSFLRRNYIPLLCVLDVTKIDKTLLLSMLALRKECTCYFVQDDVEEEGCDVVAHHVETSPSINDTNVVAADAAASIHITTTNTEYEGDVRLDSNQSEQVVSNAGIPNGAPGLIEITAMTQFNQEIIRGERSPFSRAPPVLKSEELNYSPVDTFINNTTTRAAVGNICTSVDSTNIESNTIMSREYQSLGSDPNKFMSRLADVLAAITTRNIDSVSSNIPEDPLITFHLSAGNRESTAYVVHQVLDWLINAADEKHQNHKKHNNNKPNDEICLIFKGTFGLPSIADDVKHVVSHCLMT